MAYQKPGYAHTVQGEWLDVELADRVERLESEVRYLVSERERLTTELVIAQSWMKELAQWVDEAEARAGGRVLAPSAAGDMEILQTGGMSGGTLALPLRGVAVLAAAAVVAWAMLGGLAYLLWLVVP